MSDSNEETTPNKLSKFTGTTPYASELFGIYQPLLGWKSKQTQDRIIKRTETVIKNMFDYLETDPRVKYLADTMGESMPIRPDKILYDPRNPPDPPPYFKSEGAKRAYGELIKFQNEKGRLPSGPELKDMFSIKNLQEIIEKTSEFDSLEKKGTVVGDSVIYNKSSLTDKEIEATGAKPIGGTELLVAQRKPKGQKSSNARALVEAGMFNFLSNPHEEFLKFLIMRANKPFADSVVIDPLADFDFSIQQAFLSPIGIVQLFRQYFFELESFLGPPVEHVWISPGSTVEVIETKSRRILTERSEERIREITTQSEIASMEQDELSEATKSDNQRNIDVGVSTSGGVNFAVWHAEGSANFGYKTSQAKSQEVAHKKTRQQSEKLSSMIRSNFRSTFRTTTEVTDTSSRRYLLQNTTDKIVNYELRRKMRRIAVQLQHVGTQLCWQIYIDEPGQYLGISELVHIAKPNDTDTSLEPPERPIRLKPIKQPVEVLVPFTPEPNSEINMEDNYRMGKADGKRIVYKFDFPAEPPEDNYELTNVISWDYMRVNPEAGMPTVTPEFEIDKAKNIFTIILVSVTFAYQSVIKFNLELLWNPKPGATSTDEDAYKEKAEEYRRETARKTQLEYVKAVRERIKLVGEVPQRPSPDLRQEERTILFRRIVEKLKSSAVEKLEEDDHVTIELIRSIFDMNSMLYFVAPEWWKPRNYYKISLPKTEKHTDSNSTEYHVGIINESSLIGWSGEGGNRKNNYYITEESKPARLGSSLGWLLQYDGDDRRNEFLNSPYVKVVIPIHPGREKSAINWLKSNNIEGVENLKSFYIENLKKTKTPDQELDLNTEARIRLGSEILGRENVKERDLDENPTIEDVLLALADEIQFKNTNFENTRGTEKVYETGFEPLGGFKNKGPFEIFDEWEQILPTDQVVAVEYNPDEHL